MNKSSVIKLKTNLSLHVLKIIIARSIKDEELIPRNIEFSYRETIYLITFKKSICVSLLKQNYSPIGEIKEIIIDTDYNDSNTEKMTYNTRKNKKLIILLSTLSSSLFIGLFLMIKIFLK